MRNVLMIGACAVVGLLACGGDDATNPANPDGGGGGDTSVPDVNVATDGNVATDVNTTPPDSAPPNGKSPSIAGCDIFPPDNPWNTPVDGLALSADSAKYLAKMSVGTKLHPDWGTFSEWYGIPYNAGFGAPSVKMTWTAKWGNSESDPLACPNNGGNFCYPIPSTAKIEGGPAAKTTEDRHLLYIDTAGAPSNCTLYEVYNTQNWVGPGWTAANGAIWHLGSNALRPAGWTSADAAGLAVLPGLVRYDEVKAGEIRHAIRFTMNQTQQAYIHPATHAAGDVDAALPPMGLRLRLKASYAPPGNATAEAKVLIVAMKKYGLMLADNGSNWYIGGDTNDGWAPVMDGIIATLNAVHGSDFEVVDTGPIAGN